MARAGCATENQAHELMPSMRSALDGISGPLGPGQFLTQGADTHTHGQCPRGSSVFSRQPASSALKATHSKFVRCNAVIHVMRRTSPPPSCHSGGSTARKSRVAQGASGERSDQSDFVAIVDGGHPPAGDARSEVHPYRSLHHLAERVVSSTLSLRSGSRLLSAWPAISRSLIIAATVGASAKARPWALLAVDLSDVRSNTSM